MSITSVEEVMQRRKGSKDYREYKYSRTWRVITDDPEDTPATILAWIFLPSVGDLYPGTDNVYCRAVNADPEGNDGKFWLVTAQYSSPITSSWGLLPWFRAMEVYWDFQREKVEAFVDAITDAEHPHGHPILNAAFEAFDPPVMKDVSRPVLTMVRNEEQAFDMASAIAAQDVVNNAAWPGGAYPSAPAGTAKIASITGEKMFEVVNESELVYWRVTYRIEFKWDGWRVWIVNQGFRYWGFSELVDPQDPTQGFYKRWHEFTDADGNPSSMPHFLDPEGNELVLLDEGSGTPPAPPRDQQIYWKGPFQIYREGAFTGIPNPYLELG